MKNLNKKPQIWFSDKPKNKKMKTSRLKLLMRKLRNKNYLCFPTVDDEHFLSGYVGVVTILRPDVNNNSLALHAQKKNGVWDVWYENDFTIIGNIF